MENIMVKNKELSIFGKEYLEEYFSNNIEKNIFITSLVNEFGITGAEINLMAISNDLLIARIETENEPISRLYRKDGKYMNLSNNEDQTNLALQMLIMANHNNIEEQLEELEGFPDNHGKYIKNVKGFMIPNKKLKMIQDYMYSGVNVLLKGGPGTGKTDFPQRLAEELGMKHLVIDCGTIKTPQDWFGTREYVEGEGTTFVQSELVKYLQQPSIIILDEINRTTPDCHNSIFRILDGNRKVHILPLKKTINVHPHCIIMATMNEGRSHTGVYMMDSAITDRFETFILELPTENQITKLLASRFPEVEQEFLTSLAKLTHKLNSLYETEDLNVQIGLRPAISACVLLERDNKFIDVLNQAFVGRFSNEGGVDSEATIVKQTFSGIIDSNLLSSINSELKAKKENNIDNNDITFVNELECEEDEDNY